MSIRIRPATTSDRENIRDIHMRAFPDSENRRVAKLAIDLLDEKGDPPTISQVAELDGRVVGHIAFSPVKAEDAPDWLGYILAPLAVLPECRNAGIGSALVGHGIELLREQPVDQVFVYGDPAYYGRFCFGAEAAVHFVPPFALEHPFGWQARVLRGHGAMGRTLGLTCVKALHDPALW
jgi:putative acetyltransferase